MWQVCLLVKYNIKVKSISVCVTASEEIDTDVFMMHLLTPWVWNDWVTFFTNDDNDSEFDGF